MNLFSRYRQQLSVIDDIKSLYTTDATNNNMLDGVRGIAILLVILLHCTVGITKLLSEEQIAHYISQLPEWLNIAWQARGSDIIFILCGFLVTQSLLKEYQKKQSLNIRHFYMKRLYRIYPLFLLALLLYSLADTGRLQYLIANLLFISNIIPDQKNIIPIGWSLNVQMQFYTLLPVFIILIVWCQKNLNTMTQWLLITAVIVLVCAIRGFVVASNEPFMSTPFYQFFDEESSYASDYGDLLYYNLYTRIGPFLLGLALAYINCFHQQFLKNQLASRPWINSAYFIFGFFICYYAVDIAIHNSHDGFYQTFNTTHNLLYLTFNKYLFCLGVSIILLNLLAPSGMTRFIARFLSNICWQPLSKLIYPLYLFHFPFIILAAACVFQTIDKTTITTATTGQLLTIFMLTVVFSLLFSIIPYVFIERPCIRLSRQPVE